jgi:hypothetical protein
MAHEAAQHAKEQGVSPRATQRAVRCSEGVLFWIPPVRTFPRLGSYLSEPINCLARA